MAHFLDAIRNGFSRAMNKHGSLAKELARDGQKPEFLMIGCMDSRCAPETIFDLDPGKAFTHRPMGGFVQPYEEGSELDAKLAFSIMKGVNNIVLMGHTECGAAEGLATNITNPHITPWLKIANPAFEAAVENTGRQDTTALTREIERQVVIQGINNLHQYPSVAHAIQHDGLQLHGLIYDMNTQKILRLNQTNNQFDILATHNDPNHDHTHDGACCG